jgi:hypothetical protein
LNSWIKVKGKGLSSKHKAQRKDAKKGFSVESKGRSFFFFPGFSLRLE